MVYDTSETFLNLENVFFFYLFCVIILCECILVSNMCRCIITEVISVRFVAHYYEVGEL